MKTSTWIMQQVKRSTPTQLTLLTVLLMLALGAVGCSSPSDPKNSAPTTSYMHVMVDYPDLLGGPREFTALQVTCAPCSIGIFSESGYRIDGYIEELSVKIAVFIWTDGEVTWVQQRDNKNVSWGSQEQSGRTQYFDTTEKRIAGTATASGFSADAPIYQGMTVRYAVVGW